MASTVIAGKPSNTVGDKDSVLVLRGSSVRVQWGNKFIDLIKNGKVNVEYDKILKKVDSVESIKQDGIYLVEDQIWINIDGTKVQLAGTNSDIYVSFAETQKIESDQKTTALKNIGFYYNTLEEAKAAGISSGIIYVLGDNKLYTIINGQFNEYYIQPITKEDELENTLQHELYIEKNSLWVNDDEYVRCNNEEIRMLKKLIVDNDICSSNYSTNKGFRLYINNGQSYLEVDNIIVRNAQPDDEVSIYPIKYYQEENIILSATSQENSNYLQLTMLYSSKYNPGDILTTSLLLNNEQTLIFIDFKIISSIDNTYFVSIESPNFKPELISQLTNKLIFYKKGQLPVARLKDNNYDLFEANVEHDLNNINTRIGTISPIIIGNKYISDITDNKVGIYSNNAFLVDSKQYNTIFKNLNGTYPQYEENWLIPDSSDDQTIVTSAWVKKQLKNNTQEDSGGGSGEDCSEDIAKLQEQIDMLNATIDTLNDTIKILYNGNYQNPILLMSGALYTNKDGIDWYFSGSKKSEIQNLDIVRKGGKVEVSITGQKTETEVNLGTEEEPYIMIQVEEQVITVTGVSANQYSSPYTTKHDMDEYDSEYDPITAGYRENGHGSHWFETRFSSNTFSIREFHQENKNNNSWQSGSWHEQSCRRITINVFGYMRLNKYFKPIEEDNQGEDNQGDENL